MKLKFWHKGAIIGLILGIIANTAMVFYVEITKGLGNIPANLIFNFPVFPFYLIAMWLTLIVMFATYGFIGDIQIIWSVIGFTFSVLSWVVAFAVYAILLERFFEILKKNKKKAYLTLLLMSSLIIMGLLLSIYLPTLAWEVSHSDSFQEGIRILQPERIIKLKKIYRW